MESVGTKNVRTGIETPGPHIVIACPSCKTSFAVETAAVAALEVPRFHCSRCDDIFVMRDSQHPMGGIHVQSVSRSKNSITSHIDRGASRLTPQTLIQSSDFSFGTSSPASHTPPIPVASEEDIPTPRASLSLLAQGDIDTELPSPARPTQIPPPLFASAQAAPVEPTFVAPEILADTSLLQDAGRRKFVLAEPPVLTSPQVQQPHAKPAHQAPAPKVAPLSKAPTLRETEQYRPQPPRRTAAPQMDDSNARFSPRVQSLLSMSTPILCVLTLLLGFSYCARLSPHSVDSIVKFAMPSFATRSMPHVPPSALAIKDLKLNFETTSTNETIAVVKGSVLNQSGKKFEGVEIEALGFNERGQIVFSSRAPLRSALAQEKIQNLDLETVKRFQVQLAAKDASITSREAVPFAIALVDNRQKDGESLQPADLSHIRYFSARIFSVNR